MTSGVSALKTMRSVSPLDNRGFTLLELMLAILLLAIMVVIIGGAMRLGFRSVESGERRITSLERMRVSLNTVEAQIQSQIPLTYDEEGTKKFYFRGSRNSLQMVTNFSIWGGERGYVVVNYRVEGDSAGKQALFASENTVGFESRNEARLFDGFDAISFEYFFKEVTEETGTWVEEWTDEATIPEKMKIHLVNGRNDLSMIIPLRANSLTKQIATASSPVLKSFTTGSRPAQVTPGPKGR